MKSKDGRYKFEVGILSNLLFFMPKRHVWIYDDVENKYYQLDKDKRWKKFYKTIVAIVNTEKFNQGK